MSDTDTGPVQFVMLKERITTMPGEASPSFLRKLEAKRGQLVNQAESWLRGIPSGRLTPAQEVEYRTYVDDIKGLSERIAETKSEIARMGTHGISSDGSLDAMSYGRMWSQQVADKVTRAMGRDGEERAVVSGSIDIPQLVETSVIPIARPVRLIDLFSNRAPVAGNSFDTSRACGPTPPTRWRTPTPSRRAHSPSRP